MLLLATAAAGWDLALGGEFNQDPHGIVNVRWHQDGVSLALWTDTLEARLDRTLPWGRAWAAVRTELGAAGLVISPWRDGARDRERAQLGLYAGPEGGVVAHLPMGLWVGAESSIRYYGFVPLAETSELYAPRPVATVDAIAGWWTEVGEASIRAGTALQPSGLSPRVAAQVLVHPQGPLTPFVEIRAGVAADTDEITKTRLGGLNPYVVPLAGASWAEFWVEDYAAVRAGPRVGFGRHHVSVVADVASFDGQTASGYAALLHLQPGRFTLDLAGAVAPELPRANGELAGSVFVLMGYKLGEQR